MRALLNAFLLPPKGEIILKYAARPTALDMKQLTIAIIALLLLAGCQPHGIRIGAICALTGYGAQWGQAECDAATLAVEEANAQGGVHGVPLELAIEDSRTEPAQAVSAFSKLVAVDRIQFIVGPTWEASAAAVVPAAAASGAFLISPSSYQSIEEAKAPNLFSTYPPYADEVESLMPLAEVSGWSRFAVVYNTEFYSETMHKAFQDQAQQHGWIVMSHSQEAADSDYRTALLRIGEFRPDAIYLPLSDNMNEGEFMRQMREHGMDVPVIGTASTENQQLLSLHGDAIEGIIYTFPQAGPAYAAFSERFEERYGHPPGSPSAAAAYDATNLIIAALRSGARTPEEVASYLHGMPPYEGASGTIAFDSSGIVSTTTYVLKTVEGGRFAPYDTARED